MGKKLIWIVLALIVTACGSNPKYSKGEVLCAYGQQVTITHVQTFQGTGYCGGPVYVCVQVDNLGVIHEIKLCESELSICK